MAFQDDLTPTKVYDLGFNGIKSLGGLDQRFTNFTSTLFGKPCAINRNIMAREDIDDINELVNSYLRLLCSYLEADGSAGTLKYLFDTYQIHLYNSEALIMCVLPYHNTQIFREVVKVLPTELSRKWRFVKCGGETLTKDVIISRCLTDRDVLKTLAHYACAEKKKHISLPMAIFFTSVVSRVISTTSTVDKELLNLILPFVKQGVELDDKSFDNKKEYCFVQKACAVLLVGMLVVKGADLASNLMTCTLRIATVHDKHCIKTPESHRWVRLSLMTTILFLQEQTVMPKEVMILFKKFLRVQAHTYDKYPRELVVSVQSFLHDGEKELQRSVMLTALLDIKDNVESFEFERQLFEKLGERMSSSSEMKKDRELNLQDVALESVEVILQEIDRLPESSKNICIALANDMLGEIKEARENKRG